MGRADRIEPKPSQSHQSQETIKVHKFKHGFATAIIKHNNPCGCSYENDGLKSYLNAFNADPKSAFGGVIAFNFKIEENLASELVKTFYYE